MTEDLSADAVAANESVQKTASESEQTLQEDKPLDTMFEGEEDDEDEKEEERLRQLLSESKEESTHTTTPKPAQARQPKTNPASSQVYLPGMLVWAKVRGYPWWPGRVEDEDSLPGNITSIKPNRSATLHAPILFFGTRDYGWMSYEDLRPFEQYKDELSKKNKTSSFVNAVKEANNPSVLNMKPAPPAAGPKKTSSSGKPGRRKSAPVGNEEDDEEDEDASGDDAGGAKKKAAPKKRRASETNGGDAKKKKKPVAEDDSALIPLKPEHKKEDPKTPEERLKKLRSKLQYFLQTEHSEVRNILSAEHFIKADKYLTEVENFKVDINLLLNTKIGKVMRRISEMTVEDDKFNVVERSKKIVENWKLVVDA
ncbi:hypothetical protein BJ741DRAFT_611224 [Chytriomyces cf. hyalinus JEL632]|nr:hypothetical protein BJ741DRAFT_611224 [Chytriomyces cf. hyalinus JEL632]